MSGYLLLLLTPLHQATPLLVPNGKLGANSHDKADEASDTEQIGLAR